MSQGKESTATLLNSMRQRKSTKSGREPIPNPRYISDAGGSGGGGRGGGGPPPHPRGGGRGRGRAGGRARGEGERGRGGGGAPPELDIPSASSDVASESHELVSRDEDTQSGGEGTVTGNEGTSKKPRIRGESRVPDESKMPKTEEEKILIVPNDVE